jgi:ParB/RepB/Spo0J family partition protein
MNAPLPAATLLMLDLDALGMNGPFQQRRTPASAEADAGLVESIRIMGVLQPILVRWDDEQRQHQVVDGHRRVTAARAAGLATIRALAVESDERTSLAAGVAANLQRAALAPVDQWRALVHLQEKGWSLDSAALALGTPLRLARQLDKLGRLHPDMLAIIEEHGMPDSDRWVGIIASAPLEMQAAAATAKSSWRQLGKNKREPSWYDIVRACSTDRISRAKAIFKPEESGLAWEEDLFAQPGDKDAVTTRDVTGFLEHQLDALRAKALRIKKLHLAEWDPKTSGPRLPSGWLRTFEKQTVGAERYTAVIPQGPDAGGIIEIYAVPPAPKVSAKGKAGAAESLGGSPGSDSRPAPLPAAGGAAPDDTDDDYDGAEEGEEHFDATPAPALPAKPGRGPLTEKGRILVAAAKTTAIRCALRDRRDWRPEQLLGVLVLALAGDNVQVLGDPASKYTRTSFVDLAARLVNADGSPALITGDLVLAIAAEAAARVIVCAPTGALGNTSGAAAEWIGAAIRADRDMPRLDTPEILAPATGDTLRAAAREAGLPVGGSSKALRDRLAGHAERLTLPGSAFEAPGPPRAKAVPAGHVGPFPCAGCSDVEDCIRDVVCIRAEGDDDD